MIEKPTPNEMVDLAVSDSIASQWKRGSNRVSKMGSPIQPSARLASVMPNWQALRKASRLLSM